MASRRFRAADLGIRTGRYLEKLATPDRSGTPWTILLGSPDHGLIVPLLLPRDAPKRSLLSNTWLSVVNDECHATPAVPP
jgi:hypothetical protein